MLCIVRARSKAGVNAEDAPIAEIQKTLLDQGAYLGPDERLNELGLTK